MPVHVTITCMLSNISGTSTISGWPEEVTITANVLVDPLAL